MPPSQGMSETGMFSDVEGFVGIHRGCGDLTSNVSEMFESGYQVMILCSCGVKFERWVDPEVAEHDLVYSRLPALPN